MIEVSGKMQNQENFLKKQTNRVKMKSGEVLGNFHKKLKEKGRDETVMRARSAASGLVIFLLSLILSGGRMPFDTYPLSIALICGAEKYFFAAAVGGVIGGIARDIGSEYIFACIFVFAVRFLMSLPFMPRTFLQKSGVRNTNEIQPGEVSGEVMGARAGFFYKARRFLYRLFGIIEEGEKDRAGSQSFFDRVGIKLIISASGGFVCGLFLLIRYDFSYFSLAATVFMMLACPVMSFLLSGITDSERTSLIGTVSVGAAMLLSTYAADGMSVFAMSLSPLMGMLFTLIACKGRGLAAGLFIAVFSGLCFDLRCIVPLALSCMAYYLLSGIKRAAALAMVVGVCLVWGYYFFNVDSFVLFIPPMLVALPIFLVVDKFVASTAEKPTMVFCENKYFAKSVSEESKNLAVKAKVSSLSEAFSSLSEAVNALSDKFSRPDALGLRAITDRGFERVCEGCPNYDVCFGAEYDRTVEVAGRITSALHKKGIVEEDDLGEELPLICVRQKRLIEELNTLCAERTEDVLRARSLNFFASSYDDIRDILQDAIAAGGDEYECDTVMGAKIYEYLRDEGYISCGVVVCGKRCRRVMLKGVDISPDAHDDNAMGLCKKISEIVGVRMVGPVFEVGDDGMIMMFSAKPKFSAVCASGRRAVFENRDEVELATRGEVNPFEADIKEKREELCGDVTGAFLTDTSYFYSLISDGMGSGAEAATSAGICSMFCEKMLMAGNRADITIRMLNNFLRGENRQRGAECSVTVDLFELDLMLGVASFIKSGAAPTYILRGGEVYRVASKTMPVGIIKNPDIKVTRFDMKRGDLVLMMSDGICGESDECEWIVEALCDIKIPDCGGDLALYEKHVSSFRDKLLDMARDKMRKADRFDDASLSLVLVV